MPTRPKTFRPSYLPQRAELERARDLKRGTRTERKYSNRWLRAARDYLRRNPLCVHCVRAGRYILASVVDHIVPHKGDDQLFWFEENWQSLCKRCHDRKTATEDGAFGRSVGTQERGRASPRR